MIKRKFGYGFSFSLIPSLIMFFKVCNVCDNTFTSRTKLFAHINESGHASAASEDKARPKGKRNKH